MRQWRSITCLMILMALTACTRLHPAPETQAAAAPAASEALLVDPAYGALHLRQGLDAVGGYRFGQSREGLNIIADSVTQAMNKSQDRAALAGLLLAKLMADGTADGKQFILGEFARLGQPEQVPALAQLLGDPELGQMARAAIERIPGPAADRALRQALTRTDGPARIGIVNSLGERGDQRAVGALGRLLHNPDPELSLAAASALGKIGGPAAARKLRQAVAGETDPGRRLALGNAYLACASEMHSTGHNQQALNIYQDLLRPGQPWQLQAPALIGLVELTGDRAWPQVRANLVGDRASLRQIALGLLPRLKSEAVTADLVSLLPGQPATGKALLIEALGARGAAARPALIAALDDPDEAVRLAVITALARVGDASLLQVLITRFNTAQGTEREALSQCLSRLPGAPVDAEILSSLPAASPQLRAVLIGTLARRGATTSIPTLLDLADRDSDTAVRAAALRALGDLAATPEQLTRLLDLLGRARSETERHEGQMAVLAVSRRLPVNVRVAPILAAGQAPATGISYRCDLLGILGGLGGDQALEAVVAGLSDPDEAVRESALRALVEWPGPEPLDRLLEIARTDPGEVRRVLALRGATRMLDQAPGRPEEKLALFNRLMALAKRPEDRKLALSALGAVTSLEAYTLAGQYLADPDLREENVAVILNLSGRLRGAYPAETVALLDQALAVATDPAQRAAVQEEKDLVKAVFLKAQ